MPWSSFLIIAAPKLYRIYALIIMIGLRSTKDLLFQVRIRTNIAYLQIASHTKQRGITADVALRDSTLHVVQLAISSYRAAS